MAPTNAVGIGHVASHGPRDVSKGVIVILSGGAFDWMNPEEVRDRMDQIITEINADAWVHANTQGKGLVFHLLDGQEAKHIHQARWRDLCKSPQLLDASPLVIMGHSNGGAAAMDLARCLQDSGKVVDLLFTADSVLTLDDNGDPYQVPPNVKLNLNSYSVPVFPIWWAAPFPFGKKNQRQADGSLTGILNIGLAFEEPGALEHRDVFYKVAGGDLNGDSYQYPELMRDVALAVVKGQSNQQVLQLAEQHLQILANEAGISIDLEGEGFTSKLEPKSNVAKPSALPAGKAIADLHQRMSTVEQVRLTIPDSPEYQGRGSKPVVDLA